MAFLFYPNFMKYTLVLLLTFFSLSSCCQQKKISKGEKNTQPTIESTSKTALIAQAFFTVTSPGAQMVDENGNAVNNFIVSRAVFIEYKGDEIPTEITAVTPEGLIYKGAASKVNQEGEVVGKLQNNNVEITLRPKTNHNLWKIELQPLGFIKQSTEALNYLDIKAIFGTKIFKTRIVGETQLQGQLLY